MTEAKLKRTLAQKSTLRRRLMAASQNQPKSTKKQTRTIVPPPQSARMMQRYVGGDSIRQIARDEQRDRATVTKIVRSDAMNAFVQEMRERFYALAPDALATIEYALREQKDAKIGLEVLRDIGVRPTKGESLQLPAMTPEDGFTRQAMMVANVMLEAHQHMGVPLPKGVEDALAKDARECKEAAKTPGAKLRRVSEFSGNGSRRGRTVSSRISITPESPPPSISHPQNPIVGTPCSPLGSVGPSSRQPHAAVCHRAVRLPEIEFFPRRSAKQYRTGSQTEKRFQRDQGGTGRKMGTAAGGPPSRIEGKILNR